MHFYFTPAVGVGRSLMSEHQIDKPQLILQGRVARSLKDEQGRRRYGPFCIRLEVQMTPLSISNTTLEFYVYQETGEAAIMAVSHLLKQWYCLERKPADGYPKPVKHGYAIPASDEEYRMTWQQAEHEGRELLRAGEPGDPVAFHVKPRNTRIIIP